MKIAQVIAVFPAAMPDRWFWGIAVNKYLLSGTSLLALMVAGTGAEATTFNYTGAIVDYTIPVTGIYDITAEGAQGGPGDGGTGGLAALAGGDVSLAAGTQLGIVAGGMGLTGNFDGTWGGGGGGGSFAFVVGAPLPLVVAGGGGGAGFAGSGVPGGPGQAGTAGQTGYGPGGGTGGTGGSGGGGGTGSGGNYNGGGGGGWGREGGNERSTPVRT